MSSSKVNNLDQMQTMFFKRLCKLENLEPFYNNYPKFWICDQDVISL